MISLEAIAKLQYVLGMSAWTGIHWCVTVSIVLCLFQQVFAVVVSYCIKFLILWLTLFAGVVDVFGYTTPKSKHLLSINMSSCTVFTEPWHHESICFQQPCLNSHLWPITFHCVICKMNALSLTAHYAKLPAAKCNVFQCLCIRIHLYILCTF